MFTAIFQHHYDYLAVCALVALALAAASWWAARRIGNPHARWWAGLAATLTALLGVTFMRSAAANGQCVVNHDLAEPFRTTQGLWNLAVTVPLGLFALLALRRPLPALVVIVSLPPAIEFTQGTVDGLGRMCDSADVEMNVLGGLAGAVLAGLALTARGRLDWRAGAKGALIASAVLLLLGAGAAHAALSFTHLDGTGLSPADTAQREAVEDAVREALGDGYVLGKAYEQPCMGASCENVIFHLADKGGARPDAFGTGVLSWPDRKRLRIELHDGSPAVAETVPLPGAKAPVSGKAAYEVARSYMDVHYPWAREATAHETHPLGGAAESGWMTRWSWTHGGVQMPRRLDVRVDAAGRLFQVDVDLGPARLELRKGEIGAAGAERAVRKLFEDRFGGRGVPEDQPLRALALQAVQREGEWRAEWLVDVSVDGGEGRAAPPAPNDADLLWVDSASGRVYESFFGAAGSR
ncbi:VanZ family protein [Streptomyces sp. NPDC058872]|uniref:VanZ family protein n=1 Tax=Streptomyces sp. NPDC058872 TaxID=3346661 RepID=UPI00367F3A23